MDTSDYYVEDVDRERHLLRKGKDNKYHVDGSLELASAKQAGKTTRRAITIVHALKENKKVIMAPQCRYLGCACCQDKGHCTNRGEENYRRRMLDGIKEIRREIKDLCHEEQIPLYKVVIGQPLRHPQSLRG